MAIFRKVHVSFWGDAFVHSLKESEKLFFMYLLTNEKTSQCGIYEITKQKISFDLGYSIDRVSKLLKYFISKGKIRYNEQTFELAVKNWIKYNGSESPKVKAHINQEFSKVKDKVLIQYLYSTDTQTQEEQEQEEEQEPEPEQMPEKGFEIFWKAYPKKKSKGQAETTWNKIKPSNTLLQTMLAKIEVLKTSKEWLKDGGQFIPHPSTWLNAKGWEDEISGNGVITSETQEQRRHRLMLEDKGLA